MGNCLIVRKGETTELQAEVIGTGGTMTTTRDYLAVAIARGSSCKRGSASLNNISISATELASQGTGEYGYNSGLGKDNDLSENLMIYGPLKKGSTITVSGGVNNGWGVSVAIGIFVGGGN